MRVHGPSGRGPRRPSSSGDNGVLAAIAVTAIVLGLFAVDTLRTAPQTFTAIVAILVLSVILDGVWLRTCTGRRPEADVDESVPGS